MKIKPSSPKSKKKPVRIGFKFSMRKTLWTVGIVVVLALIGEVIVYQHRQAEAVQTQQQRFNTMQSAQNNFEANVKSLLGASLVDVNKESKCYQSEQGPYSKGRLWCGVSVIGDTKELPDTVASGQGAWETITRIDAIAHNEIVKTGVDYQTAKDSPGSAGRGDSVIYNDLLYLYAKESLANGNQMSCNISGYKYSDAIIAKDPKGRPKQLHFIFSCDQRSSKMFYKFQAS